jgi:7-cyano-7-deazaguanine synthase in queuosine biosynthesis
MKTVQLYGGGIDSLCIAYLHKPDIKVYFNLGTEEALREQAVAKRAHAVIDKRLWLADQVLPNKILPARNLLLVALASYYGNRILLGSTAGDTTRDKDATFLSGAQAVLDHILAHDPGKSLPFHNEGIFVEAPALHFTKTQLVKQYLEAGGDPDELLSSRSCYHGNAVECGVCRSCLRKYVALKLNGLNPIFENKPDLEEAATYARIRNRGQETLDIERLMEL